MQEEYDEAKRWIESSLKLDVNRDVNLFETTIRVLGGLLSIYHLSGEEIFLTKAVELGNRMLPCFDSPSSIPYSDVNLLNMKAHAPKWSPDSSTSEVSSWQKSKAWARPRFFLPPGALKPSKKRWTTIVLQTTHLFSGYHHPARVQRPVKNYRESGLRISRGKSQRQGPRAAENWWIGSHFH